MTAEERLALAETVAQELNSISVRLGARDRPFTVQGADPNEVKKTYSFLCATRDVARTLTLVKALQTSAFAQRSRRTAGYYRIIQQVLEGRLSKLPVPEAIDVLGWACRLQNYHRWTRGVWHRPLPFTH
jgi:hypothetical protein